MQANPDAPGGWDDVPAPQREPDPDSQPESDGEGGPDRRRARRRTAEQRRLGRRGIIGIVAGGIVLLILVVLGFGANAAGQVRYAPARQVEAFLTDLMSGNATKAAAAAGVSTKDQPLLTNAAYAKASDRVSGYRIQSTQQTGDTATVQALLQQGKVAIPATFTLAKSGTAWGFFTTWKLEQVPLGSVQVVVDGPAGTSVSIAGAHTSTNGRGTVTLAALPGAYPVSLDDTTYYSAASTTAAVRGFGDQASSPAVLQTTLTDAGRKAATEAVNGWLTGCVASTALQPPGCSFEAYGETSGYTYTNRKWRLDKAPTFTFGSWTGAGWAVQTTASGSVTFTENISSPSGSGTGTAGPIAFSVNGLITDFSGAKATYRSLVAGGSGSTGT